MKDPEARKHLGQVLGHDWCPDEDTLSFKFILKAKMNTTRKEEVITKDNVEDIKGTKRNFLGVSSQFFDPMGLCSPKTVSFKVAFKSIVNLKVDWDTLLPEDI